MNKGYNPVLDSTRPIFENARDVRVNKEKLESLVEKLSKDKIELPAWNEPVFPAALDERTVDFFMLLNSINFYFTYPEKSTPTFDAKYTFAYRGAKWGGAYGMVAALKSALDSGVPLLDAGFLKEITHDEAAKIFLGEEQIPMLDERVYVLQEMGRVLERKYDGKFSRVLDKSKGRLFNNGGGFVERLTRDFETFDDSVMFEGKKVQFNKRAQLAAMMLHGKFKNADGTSLFSDVEDLTVCVDYRLPNALRSFGVIEYSSDLAQKVDQRKLIPALSREELEIRAVTLHAAHELLARLNIGPCEGDYLLWKLKGNLPHHLTKTLAY